MVNFDKDKIVSLVTESKFIKDTVEFINTHKKAVKISAIALFGALAVILSLALSGISLGYRVIYGGKTIATVKNYSVYRQAKKLTYNSVFGSGADGVISNLKLSVAFTFTDKTKSPDEVVDAIIENSEDVVICSVLVIDGEDTAVLDSTKMDELVTARLAKFDLDGASNQAEFIKDVVLEEGYFVKSDLSAEEDVAEIVEALDVRTVSDKTTDTIIPYSTKTVKTSNQDISYSKVTTTGQNGLSRKVEHFEFVNGVQTVYNEISNEVISSPVNQVVTVGTAPISSTNRERSAARSAGFIFPLSGSYQVSAYWGDGRGHKGIDLATNKGNAIYAVADGTVTFSGYDGGYGYSVVIDHGNGLQTRYAHASALYVQAGAKILQGDVIAAVGRTGSATGNHLHFEVIVNGTKVNPAPYISLG